jgi:predicted Zn-dependent protease
VGNGYDPRAAIKLHEKVHSAGRGFRLPFLSSHPSGDERIENLRALIEPNQRQAAPLQR